MRRTYAYFLSITLVLIFSQGNASAQDTIQIPLKIKVGLEVAGHAAYFINKNILNSEGYISVDLNEKKSLFLSAGYLNYKYSQYNYDYLNKGIFVKTGIDFNLIKPDKSRGKYWGGIGLRYGLSLFNSEIPSFQKQNYWGISISSIPRKTYWGHFFEIAPGVRAEIFRNFSLGWSVSLRKLLYTGTGKDLKPIYFPGYGNGAKPVSAGLNYFLVWNIPYKKIKVLIKKEVPEEPEETPTPGTGQPPAGNRRF